MLAQEIIFCVELRWQFLRCWFFFYANYYVKALCKLTSVSQDGNYKLVAPQLDKLLVRVVQLVKWTFVRRFA